MLWFNVINHWEKLGMHFLHEICVFSLIRNYISGSISYHRIGCGVKEHRGAFCESFAYQQVKTQFRCWSIFLSSHVVGLYMLEMLYVLFDTLVPTHVCCPLDLLLFQLPRCLLIRNLMLHQLTRLTSQPLMKVCYIILYCTGVIVVQIFVYAINQKYKWARQALFITCNRSFRWISIF